MWAAFDSDCLFSELWNRTVRWQWNLRLWSSAAPFPTVNPWPLELPSHCPLPSSAPPEDLISNLSWLRGFLQLSFPNPSSPALFLPPPLPPGKLGGQDSFESIESYDSCDRLTQSWSSQSSFNSLQRVPSYDSFDSEDYPAALPNHKPKGTFKDYVRDRADLNKDKPVIPAAALAGYTGRRPAPTSAASVCVLLWVGSVEGTVRVFPETEVSLFLSFSGSGGEEDSKGSGQSLKPLCLWIAIDFWMQTVSFCPKGSFPRVVGKSYILDPFPYLGEGIILISHFWKLCLLA